MGKIKNLFASFMHQELLNPARREQEWHVRSLSARGLEFDSRISHPCFDFFPFFVA